MVGSRQPPPPPHHRADSTRRDWRAQGDLGQGSVSDGPLRIFGDPRFSLIQYQGNPEIQIQSPKVYGFVRRSGRFAEKCKKMPKFQKTALPDLAWGDLKAQGDLGQRSVSGDPLRESGFP